ncbi:MAG: hypothetical protein QGD91_12900 [Actinomycetota bacterium]|nr:hypothetical protein [Actinomycetota bacterium]
MMHYTSGPQLIANVTALLAVERLKSVGCDPTRHASFTNEIGVDTL